METKGKYIIGEQEYSREELLSFGRQHYPRFYWIKRGVGLGLMFFGFLLAVIFVISGYLSNNIPSDNPNVIDYVKWYFYGSAIVAGVTGLVGVVLVIISFKPLPDESYIKHAIDYYTRLEANQKRREARLSQRKENKDVNQLLKYKKLLDSGAISQEEYDEKKKELL